METKLLKIDRNDIKASDFSEAARLLQAGELVAFPTETVYGLGGNALDTMASKKIYEAKGRPSDNPLIVHIANVDALSKLAIDVPKEGYALAEAFWPGPLTMIFQKSDIVPTSTTGGLSTVAIRMPGDEIALTLIRECGLYIAAPSANVSGRPSTTKAEHVFEDLSGRIAMVIDGGASRIGLESTILDLSAGSRTILRPGYITRESIEAVIGQVEVDPAVLAVQADKSIVAKAPGMKYRHYAPKGELTIYQGEMRRVIQEINKAAKIKMNQGYQVGILATQETIDSYHFGIVKSIGKRTDEYEIAAHLFGLLREFDTLQVPYIFSESFEDNSLGQAIMNRLLKAAGYRVIRLQ